MGPGRGVGLKSRLVRLWRSGLAGLTCGSSSSWAAQREPNVRHQWPNGGQTQKSPPVASTDGGLEGSDALDATD